MNIYKIEPSEFNKILHNKIAETYEIDINNTINHINKDSAILAIKLKIKDKPIELNSKNDYILFKDTKRNFMNKK